MALETGGSISIAPRRMTTGAAADLARPEARRVSHRNDVRLSQFVGQKLVTLLLTTPLRYIPTAGVTRQTRR
jgi:hypothetical protein